MVTTDVYQRHRTQWRHRRWCFDWAHSDAAELLWWHQVLECVGHGQHEVIIERQQQERYRVLVAGATQHTISFTWHRTYAPVKTYKGTMIYCKCWASEIIVYMYLLVQHDGSHIVDNEPIFPEKHQCSQNTNNLEINTTLYFLGPKLNT